MKALVLPIEDFEALWPKFPHCECAQHAAHLAASTLPQAKPLAPEVLARDLDYAHSFRARVSVAGHTVWPFYDRDRKPLGYILPHEDMLYFFDSGGVLLKDTLAALECAEIDI